MGRSGEYKSKTPGSLRQEKKSYKENGPWAVLSACKTRQTGTHLTAVKYIYPSQRIL